MNGSIYERRRPATEYLLTGCIYLSALFCLCLLAGMAAYIFAKGSTMISWTFLTTATSAAKGTTGILGNMINTVYVIICTLLIAMPLGVGAAIYINEYAKRGKVVEIIEFTTETLAGIPSIIFGMFGLLFFGMTLGLRYSILTGSLTLTLMLLPLITRTTQEALKAVPEAYRMGALGLGASKWYMIRTIILPSAMPGIVTGLVLALGRIAGESAALLFTAGSGYFLPKDIVEKIFQPGGTLTIQMYIFMQNAEYDKAFGIAVVLLVLGLVLNLAANRIIRRFRPEA